MGYQRLVKLSYADRLLSEVQREFRDRYKNELLDWKSAVAGSGALLGLTGGLLPLDLCDFKPHFLRILHDLEGVDRLETSKPKYASVRCYSVIHSLDGPSLNSFNYLQSSPTTLPRTQIREQFCFIEKLSKISNYSI